MAAASRLGTQLQEIVATLGSAGASFALIDGLALAPHKVVRATQDIDLLMDAAMADRVHDALLRLGYECLHRSADAANYLRGDERVDFIYAHRPAALRLLRSAKPVQTDFGPLHVVSVEGLIGLKLQAHANDPHRVRDLDDIRSLIAANQKTIDMDEVRGSVVRPGIVARPASEMSDYSSKVIFTADGGLERAASESEQDPFKALDELMVVVEALCPTWPERPTFAGAKCFLL